MEPAPAAADAPGRARTRARAVECALLFVGIPLGLAAWSRIQPAGVPVIPVLVGLALTIGVLLARDPAFSWRDEATRRAPRGQGRATLARTAAGVAALTLLVALLLPERFLDFPRANTGLWLAVMVGYPLLSVVPQEIVYRSFFFHRYEALFGGATVYVSAAAFGLAHLLFWNWIAVALTLIGGVLFSWTYERTRSLRLVSLEHALYGQAVFTVGLGEFFYGGTIQVMS